MQPLDFEAGAPAIVWYHPVLRPIASAILTTIENRV